ncbi:MAG: hypothetical protein WA994_05015 [Ornithinimicrobium sp.]
MSVDLGRDLELAQEALQDTLEQYWFRHGGGDASGWPLDGVYASLDHVQEGITADDPRAEALATSIAELRAHVDRLAQSGRPILENPAFTQLLARLRGDVETELDRTTGPGRDVGLRGRLAVGLLPTGTPNAVTRTVSGTDTSFIVLLDDGVFVLQNLGAKALARSFPQGTDPDGPRWLFDQASIRAELDRAPEQTWGRFSQAVLALAAEGGANAAEQYLPEPGWDDLSYALRRGGELFVLSHEYGHVQRGHLAEQRAARAEEPGEARVVARDWEREHEADVTGMEVTVAILRDQGTPPWLAAAAVGLALEIQHAFELVVRVLSEGNLSAAQSSLAAWYARPGATHPPPMERRSRLREVVEGEWGDEAPFALHMWDTFSATTGLLAERAVQMAELMHHRHGTRPSPRWEPMLTSG